MKTDIVIIGSGPGGYIAALRAAQLGAQVVLVERDKLGGVCLNVGCIPTKALLRSAEVYELVREAGEFGVRVESPAVDWPAMQQRKAEVVERLVSGIGTLLDKAGVQVLHGHARFLSANTISVQGPQTTERIQANAIIIATGSRPATIPVPGLDSPRVLDSTGALSLEALPSSMAVIGGGAVGVEFAGMFSALGVDVTVIEMLPRLLPRMDELLGKTLARSFKKRKIKVHTDTTLKQVLDKGDTLEMHIERKGKAESFEAEMALVAVSRQPNVENLDLEAAGVQYTRRGIPVDAGMRTNIPHIYAIGDVVGGVMLAHWASHMGVAAAENAMGGHATVDEKALPSCVFTSPEVASVGLSEEDARAKGHEVQIGEFPFLANGKALAHGETDGAVKIVADAQYGAILGLHIIGPHASDLVLPGTLAINLETTLDEFKETIWPHPTLGESVGEAALVALGIPLAIPAKKR